MKLRLHTEWMVLREVMYFVKLLFESDKQEFSLTEAKS